MGREWDRLGNQDRSYWCIRHAVGYAQRLEALMCSEELPATVQEQCILQLFNLYLQAARESSKSMQQSLANNMLAKALYLSKKESVLPSTKAAMSLGLAELQVEQAWTMIKSEGKAAALVLFEAAEKHVSDALYALEACEAASHTDFDQHQHLKTKAEQMQVQVLVATAKAHLAAGEAMLGLRKVDSLKLSSSFSSLEVWFCSVGCLLIEIYLALEDFLPAAHILLECGTAASTNETHHSHPEMFKTWMNSFQATLEAIPTTTTANTSVSELVAATATAVADAALAAIHSAAGTKQPSHVEAVLTCLLKTEGKENICLRVLAANDVLAIIAAVSLFISLFVCCSSCSTILKAPTSFTFFSPSLQDSKLQSTCYSMLRTLACQHFHDSNFGKCASLLTAALQYAPRNCKAKTAELLSATHLRFNNPKKALEYLEIAAKHGGGHLSSLGALVKMSAAFFSSNTALGQKALHSLKACPDFHVETAQAAAQIAKISSFDPVSEAQVTAMAVNVLIPQDNAPSTMASGQECALLSSWIHALLRHVLDLKKVKQSSDKSSVNEEVQQRSFTETIDSLVVALKLSTKRLKAIGAEKFSGSNDGDGITKLGNLALQGYRACVEALELGLHDQCVTISSSTCVLLEDLVPYKGDEIHALQSNVLLLAAQSLLSAFHGSLPTTNGSGNKSKHSSRLQLASKLLKKAAEKAAKAGHDSHPDLYPAVNIMLLEVASIQGNQADMVGSLQAFTENSSCTLTDVQIVTVIRAVSAASSKVKSAACTAMLHNISTAGALSTGVLGELLYLAQGSKQKIEVIKQAMKLNSSLCTPNGVPTEQSNNTSQQRLREQQWLAAECYNTGVSYSQLNPRNAIPFFQIACDLDPRLDQACSTALEKLKLAAEKQPPSPPLLAERPKKKKEKGKKPAPRIVSQPIALEDGNNGRARPHSSLPTVGKLGSAENGEEPPMEEQRSVKILKPQPSPPSAPARATENLKVNVARASSLAKASPKEPRSALKRRQNPTQAELQLKEAAEAVLSPATAGGASPSRASPLPIKPIPTLPSKVSLPSRVRDVTSPPPSLSELKKEASSLLVPFARHGNDDEEVAPKRQKKEAPSAAATAVALPVAPPPSGPLFKKTVPKQKQTLHQRKQAPGWLSSMLSAQEKASENGVGVGNGGGGGASQKRKAGSGLSNPPRLTTTSASPSLHNVPAPVIVQDTADALSLDSGGDLS